MSEAPPLSPGTPGEPVLAKRKARWGPWATLAWGLAAAAVMVSTQTLGAVLYVFWQRSAHPDQPIRIEDLPANGPALTAAVIVSAPFLVGFIAIAVKLSRQSFDAYLGLRWPNPGEFLIGVAVLASVLALSSVTAALLGIEAPAFTADTFASAAEAGLLPLYVFAFAVLAPAQEEILFRGFLYRGLAPTLGPAPAVVLLSAVWAVFHVQYAWFFVGEVFVLGLAFGWLRHRSGSMLLTFMLHTALNGFAMLEAAIRADCSG